jgi:hypothetical protein
MGKVFVSLTLISVALIATQATAETAAKKKKDPNEVICKRVYPTGTRAGWTNSCATRAEWKAQADGNSQALQNFQKRSGAGKKKYNPTETIAAPPVGVGGRVSAPGAQ